MVKAGGRRGSVPHSTGLTLGARKLLKYLQRNAILRTEFAEKAGVSRLQLYRVLAGETVQISLDFALAVSRATDGEIAAADFSYATVPAGDSVRRRGAAKRVSPAARAE